jgi:hypothetical protein
MRFSSRPGVLAVKKAEFSVRERVFTAVGKSAEIPVQPFGLKNSQLHRLTYFHTEHEFSFSGGFIHGTRARTGTVFEGNSTP